MIFKGSRYTSTPPFNRGGTIMLTPRVKKSINTENASYHHVVEGDTLDGISFRYYGRSDLYWAILDCNPKYQTDLDIQVGDWLVIPEFTEVVKLL